LSNIQRGSSDRKVEPHTRKSLAARTIDFLKSVDSRLADHKSDRTQAFIGALDIMRKKSGTVV
jgi:hypothetical protein